MILIFPNLEFYKRICDDIVCTPSIDGSSPILFQETPTMSADGIRCCIEYDFDEATCDWIEAYTADEKPAIILTNKLPDDWYNAGI